MDKKLLRKQLRSQRDALPVEEREVASERVRKRLLDWLRGREAGRLYSYVERGSEVATSGFLRDAIALGWEVYGPAEGSRSQPTLARFMWDGDKLIVGIPYAGAELEQIVRSMDVFVVPALGWDRDGYRIGFGGGFFDRLLPMAGEKAILCGVGFEEQVVEQVPRDDWDVAVGWLFTPGGVVQLEK